MSHVKVSFEMPEYTADADGVGVLRLLEAIKSSGIQDKCRFYPASADESNYEDFKMTRGGEEGNYEYFFESQYPYQIYIVFGILTIKTF